MNNFTITATYKDTGETTVKENQMIFFAPDGTYMSVFDQGYADKKSVLYFEAFSEIKIIPKNGYDTGHGWIWDGKELRIIANQK